MATLRFDDAGGTCCRTRLRRLLSLEPFNSARGRQTMTVFLRMFALVASICLWGAHAMAAEGLTTIKSHFGPKDTMDRLEAEVKARGMTVFAHIDHAKGAALAGVPLRP